MEPDAQNLTGVWQGLYSYRFGLGSVAFVATLIESGTTVTGTTHEPSGRNRNVTLYASLVGSRHGTTVAFVKTYDGSDPDYATVSYEGVLSPDGTRIEGRWFIPAIWSGRFVMTRPARKVESVARRAFERAS